MIRPRNDTLCGLLFLAIAIGFGWVAVGYDMGSARRMGPGFFPLLAAIILGLFGLMIIGLDLLQAIRGEPEEAQALPIPWVSGLIILGSILFFSVTASGLGLVPTLAVSVLMASRAGHNSWRQSAVQSLVLTVMCTVIFQMCLGLQLPLFGPWLTGA